MTARAPYASFARGSLWQTFSSGLLKVSSLVFLIFLGRFFSPEEVGLFYYAFSVIGAVTVLADLGTSVSLYRYIKFYEGKKYYATIKKLLNASFFIGALSSLIVFSLIFLLAGDLSLWLNNAELETPLRVLSFLIIVNDLFSFSRSLFFGRDYFSSAAFLDNAQNSLKALLTIAFFFALGNNASSIALAVVLAPAIALAFSSKTAFKAVSELDRKSKETVSYKELLKETLPYGLFLSSTAMMSNLFSHADKILLGYFALPADLGTYALVAGLSPVILMFANSIRVILVGQVSKLSGEGKQKEINAVTALSTKASVLLSVPFFLAFIAFPREVLHLLYGLQHVQGGVLLSILSIGTLAYLFSFMQAIAISSARRLREHFKIVFFGGVSSIAFNLALIPSLGVLGAAIGTSLSLILTSIVTLFYGRKVLKYEFNVSFFKKYLASLAIVLVLTFLLKHAIDDVFLPTIIAIPVILGFSSLVFAGLSLKLKALNEQEFEVLREVKSLISRKARKLINRP